MTKPSGSQASLARSQRYGKVLQRSRMPFRYYIQYHSTENKRLPTLKKKLSYVTTLFRVPVTLLYSWSSHRTSLKIYVMTEENPVSTNTNSYGFFSRDLSLIQQREQLKSFIDDYSEKLLELADGEDKDKCAQRLASLHTEYARIQKVLRIQRKCQQSWGPSSNGRKRTLSHLTASIRRGQSQQVCTPW